MFPEAPGLWLAFMAVCQWFAFKCGRYFAGDADYSHHGSSAYKTYDEIFHRPRQPEFWFAVALPFVPAFSVGYYNLSKIGLYSTGECVLGGLGLWVLFAVPSVCGYVYTERGHKSARYQASLVHEANLRLKALGSEEITVYTEPNV